MPGTQDLGIGAAPGWREFERGGGDNVVIVENHQDGRFKARGNADLDRIRGDSVTPQNVAQARSSCTDCQSVAVAIQVVLYRRGAHVVTPVNRAVALNERCTRCVTVARALQWVIPVDDPREVPEDVDRLVKAINREMHYFETIKDVAKMDPAEAEAHLNRLQSEVLTLQQYVHDIRDESRESSDEAPTPGPSTTPTTSGTSPPSPRTATPSPGAPNASPSVSPLPAASPTSGG